MKNITFKGMRTMPSEHEAKDGELSLAINLVAHDGELHPRQIIDNELEQYVDADGESFRLMHRHGTLAIYEHHDDEHTYRYFWRETATGTDDEPHLFWCDERGRAANAISEMDDLVVTAFDDEMVYSLFDETERRWHHLRPRVLRYTVEVDQRQQEQVVVSVPVDSTLRKWLTNADQPVSGHHTLLKNLFCEWQSGTVATGATLALAHIEQSINRAMAIRNGLTHKHITFGIAALRLFDGTHILLSLPFALLPANGEPTLTVEGDGERQWLRTTTCLHQHTVKVAFAEEVDEMMVRRLVQGIDLYLSEPLTLLDLTGAASESDEEGMAIRLTYHWCTANELERRMGHLSYHHSLHITLADFGRAMAVPHSTNDETLDIHDLRRQGMGASVLHHMEDHLCAAAVIHIAHSPFAIAVNYRFANQGSDHRDSTDQRLLECFGGERPDIDEHEEGLAADVVSVVHLREGDTSTTHTFLDHLRYPLAGGATYPDPRAYALDLHLRFADSQGEHHYRRSITLRPVGDNGMALGVWTGQGNGHAMGRHAIHSLFLQQARSVSFDISDHLWHPAADLWVRESADEWVAAAAQAERETSFVRRGNLLVCSEAHNPLVFPREGQLTIGNGTITALTTRVKRFGGILFGQYPLYAFCTDGVWALQRGEGVRWKGKMRVSRQPNVGGAPSETDDDVVYLSTQGLLKLDGNKVSRLDYPLSGDLFDASTLPFFDKMMSTLFGNRFPLPLWRKPSLGHCRVIYDEGRRQVSIVDPTQTLFATCHIDSGEWGLVEYGIDGEATLPVVALTRPISDADHVPRRLKSVKVCGQFRHRCQTDEPLLCTLLWGSNDQYHWHLVGSSRCTTLQLSTGSPWRWHRIAVAGWMAPDERLGHIMVRGEG